MPCRSREPASGFLRRNSHVSDLGTGEDVVKLNRLFPGRHRPFGPKLQMRRSRLFAGILLCPLICLFIASVVCVPIPAPAQSFDEQAVAKFYRGKTVKIVVGLGAGASYDITARAISRSLGRHIPGNPIVIVENLPGAGGLLAVNQVSNAMLKDGTIIGNVGGPILANQVFGHPGVRFDASKMHVLASPAPITHMLFVTKQSGVTNFQELTGSNPTKQVKLGSTAQPSPIYNSAVLTREAVGLNFQIVTGYDGFAKVKLALEQGEVNAAFDSIDELLGLYRDKVESGEWRILAAVNDKPHPRAPNLPYLTALAKSDADRELLRLGAIVPLRFAFFYFLAPEVPQDRAKALEQAFNKTLADSEFLAEMEKVRLVVAPVPAEEVRRLVSEFLGMPEAIKNRLRPVMVPGG
jgi:tripartite-type tricarboxylate transporter receptor subunit TctC